MRKYVIFCYFIACIILLCACGSYKHSQNCVSELEGVSMLTEKATYSSNSDVVKVIWKNETARTLTFGDPFYLEKKIDDGWENVGESVIFTMIGYELSPNSERKHGYNLRTYTDALEKGTYRIVTDFSDVHYPGVYEKYVLSVEFNVK